MPGMTAIAVPILIIAVKLASMLSIHAEQRRHLRPTWLNTLVYCVAAGGNTCNVDRWGEI
jgi:hypothetical protein